jgi:acyl-CoA reductase-like NAD-dependent aldehyde dehydrogenase
MGEQKDIDAAVASSRAALPGWSQKAPAERASVLNKFADILEREAEAIGELEAVCGVKPQNIFLAIELPLAVRAFRCKFLHQNYPYRCSTQRRFCWLV